jgi:hypothetical protein
MANYGTLVKANLYFAGRLYTDDWDRAGPADRMGAMVQATELIDQFDYIDEKYTVRTVLDAADSGTDWTTAANMAILRAAEAAQDLEFPRGKSNVVPTEVEWATYLIAKALLSGRDPDQDLENLSIRVASFGGVRNTYDREGEYNEHIAHLIPSPEAWTLIRPFLRDRDTFTVKRV